MFKLSCLTPLVQAAFATSLLMAMETASFAQEPASKPVPANETTVPETPASESDLTLEQPIAEPLPAEKTAAKSISVENAVLKIVEERNIPARVSGIILKSLIREGSIVELNQPLMKIDDAETRTGIKKSAKEVDMATLEAASRVELEYSERSIEVAEAELIRAQRSNQRRPGVIAQSEMDQLSLVVNRALAEKQKTEFQIEMRAMSRDVQQFELEMDQLKLAFHQIKAPLKGMIVEIFRREGEWVQVSESVARVVRLDILRTEVKLPAEKALDRLLGSVATFYPQLQTGDVQETYPGKVVFIFPEANPISSEVRVWVEIENSDLKLIPGLTGRLEIEAP